MRNQYKVLTEKYNLILENPAGWDLIKSDPWYTILKRLMPLTPESYTDFINWFNKHGEEWAEYNYEMLSGQHCANDLLEHIMDLSVDDIYSDKNFDEWVKTQPKDPGYIEKVINSNAKRMVTKIVYDGFKTWYDQEQKRLAALNKDNPGIEMDI